jgi:hypothetical protein
MAEMMTPLMQRRRPMPRYTAWAAVNVYLAFSWRRRARRRERRHCAPGTAPPAILTAPGPSYVVEILVALAVYLQNSVVLAEERVEVGALVARRVPMAGRSAVPLDLAANRADPAVPCRFAAGLHRAEGRTRSTHCARSGQAAFPDKRLTEGSLAGDRDDRNGDFRPVL